MRRQRIVAQALLEQAGQSRPHERPVDPELVHQLQPRFRVAIGRNGANRFAHDLPARLALRVPLLEVLLLRPGRRDDFEGRVRDVVADDVADGDLRPTLHVHVLDESSYSAGRNFVNASVVSYMWLSTSNTGKSRTRDGIGCLLALGRRRRPPWLWLRASDDTEFVPGDELVTVPQPAATRRPGPGSASVRREDGSAFLPGTRAHRLVRRANAAGRPSCAHPDGPAAPGLDPATWSSAGRTPCR